ncbi:uncharacterized protein LOC122054775 [Zingiber officinale]|uniref:uncharacterized protein LOC122054775 n=1 Tax=Zingiber officinale TaxID=94328 RepID=UPI001C4B70A5|nr:uncharacterized protein LOC122054775 [Zingiber officinale]
MGEYSHGDGRRKSFTDLHSRLERLDKSLTELMEGRHKLSKTTSSGGTERQCLLPDLPVEATSEKREVLDRVSQLEHWLAKLRLKIEASCHPSSSIGSSLENPSIRLNSSSKQPFSTKNKQEIVPAQQKDNQQIVLGKPFRNKNNFKCEIVEEDGSTSDLQEKDEKIHTGMQQKKIKSKPGNSWRYKRLLGC